MIFASYSVKALRVGYRFLNNYFFSKAMQADSSTDSKGRVKLDLH